MDRSQTRLLLILSALVIAVATVLYLGKDAEEPADEEATAEVWSVDPTTATRVEVVRNGKGQALTLEKRDQDWYVADPEDRADEDQVNDLLETLKQVELGIPVDGAASHAQDFGLGDPPESRVRLQFADGTEATLDVGVEAPVGFRTYVRAKDGGVAAVNGDLNRPLQSDIGRFRDHHVLKFDAADVRDVVISGPDGVLHVHGQHKDWFVDGFGRADPDRVDDLVVGLLGLRYDAIGDDVELGEVKYEVRVTSADGATVSLQTGAESPDGVVVAASDGRKGRVWPDLLKQLGRGPSDLALDLLFAVHLDDTDQITVTGAGRTVVAKRDAAAWHADGADDAATYAWVNALALARAQVRRDAPPMPAPIELTVEVREGDRAWTIDVGPPVDGFRSAHDRAADAAVRIPTGPVDEVLAALGTPSTPGPAPR